MCGESALDRLACALGGKTMLPKLLAAVPQMLQVRKEGRGGERERERKKERGGWWGEDQEGGKTILPQILATVPQV